LAPLGSKPCADATLADPATTAPASAIRMIMFDMAPPVWLLVLSTSDAAR
jgi:hypothetical protein